MTAKKREHAGASTLRARRKGARIGWNADPTANEAIAHLTRDEGVKDAQRRYTELMERLKPMIWEAGFILLEAVRVEDVTTKKWFPMAGDDPDPGNRPDDLSDAGGEGQALPGMEV